MMKMNYAPAIYPLLFLFISCAKEKTSDPVHPDNIHQHLQKLSEIRIEAEEKDDLKNYLSHYDENAISMPEYQTILQGSDQIETFYETIFQRQNVKTLQRKAGEVIDLGKTIVEIGTFKKEYTHPENDTLITQSGKYWNVWDVKADGTLKLKGEAFGFFHPVKDPEMLVVKNTPMEVSDISSDSETSFELKAYNALMEKGVRNRDGVLRSEFFTDDGSFMPFADSTVTGMAKIKPYLIAYSSRGKVTIDSISCYTYHSEYFDDHVLEYAKFRVKWSTPQFSGRTQGKGIRIWKRQEDRSLKLYREIGTHNHLE
jgi:ketosteroid isomerase-like protein